MAVVDYEGAWHDLLALIVSRDGWGSRTLATEAVDIAASHRVPDESDEDRAGRMNFGQHSLAVNRPGKASSADGGQAPAGTRDAAPGTEGRGGRDAGSPAGHHEHHPPARAGR